MLLSGNEVSTAGRVQNGEETNTESHNDSCTAPPAPPVHFTKMIKEMRVRSTTLACFPPQDDLLERLPQECGT